MTNELTRLFDAINDNDNDTVLSLTTSGAVDVNDVEFVELCRQWPLGLASAEGNIAIVKTLLEAGARIDAIDPRHSHTACHLAIDNEQSDIVALLIERGADLSVRDVDDRSLLYAALLQYDDRCATMLLDAGAPMNLQGDALVAACAKSSAVLTRLMARNVNVAALCDSQSMTPCHLVAENRFEFDAESADRFTLMSRLVKHAHVEVNALDQYGYTALHYAAQQTDIAMMRLLVRLGCDANIQAANGMTALHIVSFDNVAPCATLLLAAGADIALTDRHGRSAAELVAMSGYYDPMCCLLAAGADFDALDSQQGRTLRELANEAGCQPPVPSAHDVATARRRIGTTRLEFVRYRALEVCIGLQPLALDALQLCEIMVRACEPETVAQLIPMHHWWTIATMVKHFQKGN